MGASGAAGGPPSESVSMLRLSVTQVGERAGGRMVPGGTGETAVKEHGSCPAGGKSQNLQRAVRALWNLMQLRSSTRSLAASQTRKRDAMRASALSMMESSSITKRIEFMSDTETVVSLMSSGIDMRSETSKDWGDAWSSPLLSVVALESLDVREKWGSAI